MYRHLKHYLIPHEGNDHKPHLLRESAVLVLALIVVLTFGFSAFQAQMVRTNDRFLAAVVPAVVIDNTNAERVRENLSTLTVSPVLEEAARLKAEHMAKYGYFAHESPDGLSPWYWFEVAGYPIREAGENLAVNFVDSEDAVRAWMNSPGHRANILNPQFKEIGIAAVPGTYRGRKTVFVVQLFGTRAEAATTNIALDTTPVPVIPAPLPVTETAPSPTTVPVTEVPRLALETSNASDVRGESISTVVEETQQDKNDDATLENVTPTTSLSSDQSTSTVISQNEEQATAWEHFLAQPRMALQWVYALIGLLVALVLVLMVFIRIQKQHGKNILYGVLLLVLIGLLCYLNYLLIAGHLQVV